MRVRIAQCLCGPKRHAILAMGINDEMTDAAAIELLQAAVQGVMDGKGAELGLRTTPEMNPWCALCGAPSSEWKYEIGWSKPFESWDAALVELRQSEGDQIISAAVMDVIGESFDARTREAIKRQVDQRAKK